MIKDALQRLERKEFIEEFVREHFSNFNPKSLNEGFSLSDLRDKIVSILSDVSDFGILNDILNRLFRTSFEEELDFIFDKKSLDQKTRKEFNDIFYGISGTLEEKKECLDAMKKGGILSGKNIENASSITSMLDSKIMLKSNPFILSLYERIKNWKAPLGAKSGVGSGEGLFVLFIEGGSKGSKGDVFWGGKEYEVKANSKASGGSGGRLVGTTSNWGSTTKAYEYMMGRISNVTSGPVPTDPNKLNLIPTTIGTWNGLLTGSQKDVIKFFEDVISEMYTNKKVKMSWIKESISKDGKVLPEFFKNFAIFQFEYYMAMEGFDAIVFLNNGNDKVLTVKSAKQYGSFIESGNIIFSGFLGKKLETLHIKLD